MPPHQDVELVTGSYGTRCNAEPARGVLDFDPWPAYVSGGESWDFDPRQTALGPHRVERNLE